VVVVEERERQPSTLILEPVSWASGQSAAGLGNEDPLMQNEVKDLATTRRRENQIFGVLKPPGT